MDELAKVKLYFPKVVLARVKALAQEQNMGLKEYLRYLVDFGMISLYDSSRIRSERELPDSKNDDSGSPSPE